MNIIEAIKSGKGFRLGGKGQLFMGIGPISMWSLTQSEILSDDWKIEETKISFTRTEFIQAISGIQITLWHRQGELCLDQDCLDTLAEKLGFPTES